MAGFPGFDTSLVDFLMDLEENNNRDWFQANKDRYEALVREPALAFIEAMAEPLEAIAPSFRASARRQGGSLMRVYRDTRFSRDKTPYKTNVGIQFRHEQGKDVHAPGYYLHIDPDSVFIGAGMWRPHPEALKAIRARIEEKQAEWSGVRDNRTLVEQFDWPGEALKRPPRGYDAEHPHIDDLKRKSFILTRYYDHDDILEADIVARVIDDYATAEPMMRFLCVANGAPF